MPSALRAWSAEDGPASTAAPPGSSWQWSHTRAGSPPRRAAAANDIRLGSAGHPEPAASVPPPGPASISTTPSLRRPGGGERQRQGGHPAGADRAEGHHGPSQLPAPTSIRLASPAAASDATSSASEVETWSENTVGLSESADATSTASTVAPTGLPLVTVPVLPEDDEATGTTCTRSPGARSGG